MNRKLKLALAALLGFSTACSTIKNASSKGTGEAEIPADSVKVDRPMIVMYGVRPPKEKIDRQSLNTVLQQDSTATAPQQTEK